MFLSSDRTDADFLHPSPKLFIKCLLGCPFQFPRDRLEDLPFTGGKGGLGHQYQLKPSQATAIRAGSEPEHLGASLEFSFQEEEREPGLPLVAGIEPGEGCFNGRHPSPLLNREPLHGSHYCAEQFSIQSLQLERPATERHRLRLHPQFGKALDLGEQGGRSRWLQDPSCVFGHASSSLSRSDNGSPSARFNAATPHEAGVHLRLAG